ncbi:MAG: site-specific integrase, partial [Chryseolinea sp.]
MKSTNTFGIHFVLRKGKIKAPKATLYCRITVNTSRLEMSLKRLIDPKIWNDQTGMARGSREEVKSLNHYLAEVKSRMIECYQEMQLEKLVITADAIKNRFQGIYQQQHTLAEVIEHHNTRMSDTLAYGTIKNYFTTQKYIQKFLKAKFKTSDVHLYHLSYSFIVDFEHFLRNYKPVDHHKPIQNNGVMKHIERFRKMINMSIRLEWLDKDPFVKYQQKFVKVTRGFLTQEELNVIESKTLLVERLQWVRDLFVFSCYTGLAYIDTMKLTPSNICLGMDGDYWLMTKREKTDNEVRVPLLPKAMAIIEKYKDHPRALNSGTAFPTISNQKMNSYLKEIADLC